MLSILPETSTPRDPVAPEDEEEEPAGVLARVALGDGSSDHDSAADTLT